MGLEVDPSCKCFDPDRRFGTWKRLTEASPDCRQAISIKVELPGRILVCSALPITV